MPFLAGLLEREHYRLASFYSGLPSSTPAVQGELLYGVPAAVPAFSYVDRATRKIMRMYDPAAALPVEERLAAASTEPLLAGGSAYSLIFTGGAAEAHFCASSLGWGELKRAANPFVAAVLIAANLMSAVRMAGRLLAELAIALVQGAIGLARGTGAMKEIKFVPTRVAIAIGLRDLITIGAEMDVARGLPVVHLNFLGYDEHAHRRGPGSGFAHWTLKGIDDAVRRIWRAARRSARRDYDVWIYSDHGQGATVPFDTVAGKPLEQALAEALVPEGEAPPASADGRGEQQVRARFLGGRRLQRLLPVHVERTPAAAAGTIVAAMGPLAHLYLPEAPPEAEVGRLAQRLVEARIPLVLARAPAGTAEAWAGGEHFVLPRDARRLFGPRHPFAEAAGEDLARLCHHADAGDLVLSGWLPATPSVTFAHELGSHGGPGAEETHGFALLPADIAPAGDGPAMRPADLRRAALVHQGRLRVPARPRAPRPVAVAGAPARVRLLTYNIHSCIGLDGRLSPGRIARVIGQLRPDIVALQEVDVGRSRSAAVDQARAIAAELEMEFHFHPALSVAEEAFGNAVLTHLPMRLVRSGRLPGARRRPAEPRGALWVAVEAGGVELQVINTHLGLWPEERLAQADALIGPGWLGDGACRAPRVLCGDFNAMPGSGAYRRLAGVLADAQRAAAGHRPSATWSARLPATRIDHVFVGEGLTVAGALVPTAGLFRTASDHLPLVVDLEVAAPATAAADAVVSSPA
jgi:endonuclease/exonuclease/phosphatase family metal-dependent hydrolase